MKNDKKSQFLENKNYKYNIKQKIMRLKMKQYKEKLTKSTLVKIFDDFFDSSEQPLHKT